jgi:hypothetical protein
MKRPLPNLLVMASLLLAGIALAVGPASAVERSAEQAVKGKAIEFHEISFEIPERGWERFGDQSAPNIQFIHKYGEHRGQSIAIWTIAIPPAMRGLSPKEQASKYFESERHEHYPQNWKGFVEGEREIGGKRYPTMKYVVTFPDSKPSTPTTDGLFLLYFPEDFATRQRFYVLMWQDIHPADDKGKGLNEFDAIVSSLRVGPLQEGNK